MHTEESDKQSSARTSDQPETAADRGRTNRGGLVSRSLAWLRGTRRRIEELAEAGQVGDPPPEDGSQTPATQRAGGAPTRETGGSTPAAGEPAGAGATAAGPPPTDARPDPNRPVVMPYGMRVAAEWSWRFVVVAGAVALLGFLLIQLRLIVIPVLVALLLAALLLPVTDALHRIGIPRGLAAGLTMIGILAFVGGLLTLAGQQIASGFQELSEQVQDAISDIGTWLSTLQVADYQFSPSGLLTWLQRELPDIDWAGPARTVGTTIGQVLAGFFIILFVGLFFLWDGPRIWRWMVQLFPRAARTKADASGRRAWLALTSFIRATVIIALVDALGILIVALILRVPLAVPIAVLVFLASFVPVVGAVVSGAVAVLVALVAHGPLVALLMLGGVLLVQQAESQIMQPVLMSRFVSLHPVAVVLAVAAGAYVAGIAGALFAVPIVAMINGIANELAGRTQELPQRRRRRRTPALTTPDPSG